MPPTPHDALFKAAFAHADIARSELELVLPPEVCAHLDMGTLSVHPGSFVDEELGRSETDLLYTVRTAQGGEALVYVLFEHQSSFDVWMPLRLLRYIVRVWDRWVAEHPEAKAVPLVLPVVLHQGPTGWQKAPELGSALDASKELLAAARPFLPLFRFVLDDLATASLEALSSRTVHALARLVAMAFWSSRSMHRLRAAAPFMAEIGATLERNERTRELLTQLYVYLLRAAQPDVEVEEVRTILMQVGGPLGQEDIVNAGETLIEQGRVEGLARGRAEGLAQGLAEGRAKAILRVLTARGVAVPTQVREQILGCSDLGVLERWLDRAVTATIAAEVVQDE